MAISDRINEMYTHVGDVYDTITNVDVNNGKNLFDYNKITTSAYYTNNYDGSFIRNSNGSSITINVNDASVPYNTFSLLAGTYSVSFDIKTTATVTLYSFFMCTKQNGTGSNLAKSIGVQIPANTTTHIKAENYVVLNNAEKVGFAGYLSASTGVVISNIQVEKGTTATEYQPYTDNPTYKNIENIPSTMRSSYLEIMNNGIDTIWNNWEKVEGTGETITLNSTEEAPMKINLKGNTSQETTTGKNLLNIANLTATTKNGITLTKNNDGTITLDGTASADANFGFAIDNIVATSSYKVQLYKKGGSFTNNYVSIYMSVDSGFSDFDLLSLASSNFIAMSLGNKTYTYAQIKVNSGVVCNNLVVGCQVVSDASVTEFQKYTGGTASPNPDYPQDIHVVSGDNSINVCGKNLMDNKAISGVQNGVAYTINQDKSITLNGTSTQAFIFDIDNGRTLEAGTYTLSLKGKILGCGIYLYENNTLKAYISSNWTNDKNTFTLDKKTTFNEIRIDVQVNKIFNNITIYPMIEKGNQATTYEAYKGASYPVSLGVENLLDESVMTASTTNCHIVDNVIGTNVLSTWNAFQVNINSIKLEANVDYYATFKAKVSSGSCNLNYGGNLYDGTNWATQNRVSTDYTLTSEFKEFCWKITTTSENFVATKMGFQVGGTASSPVIVVKDIVFSKVPNAPYLPYGKAIELCKIGDYQDSIKKSTGKNLFENVIYKDNYIVASDGTETGNTLGCIWKKIKVKPNTTYTLSYKSSDYSFSQRVSEYNSSNTFIQRNPTNTSPYTFTTTATTEYINVSGLKTDTNIMINEGSTALPYEPYGKVWYLNKQIGKFTYNNEGSVSTPKTNYYNISGLGNQGWINTIGTNTYLSNEYPSTNVQNTDANFQTDTANMNYAFDIHSNGTGMRFKDSRGLSGANFKTDLIGTKFYFALATPTYTEITDSTLLSQLEAVKKSYTTQTNITQVNNDLPFILDVTALKQLTQ